MAHDPTKPSTPFLSTAMKRATPPGRQPHRASPRRTPKAAAKSAERPAKRAGDLQGSQSFGFLMRDLHRLFSRTLQRLIEEHDVTTAQWFFLRVLWDEDGLSQTDLSARVGLTTATTVVTLNTLEKKRLIERHSDPGDKRKFIVRLTPLGQRMEATLRPCGRRVNALATTGMSAKLLEQTRAVLLEMRSNLEPVRRIESPQTARTVSRRI